MGEVKNKRLIAFMLLIVGMMGILFSCNDVYAENTQLRWYGDVNQYTTGLMESKSNGWYYLKNGKVDYHYTNLVEYYGTWYYIHDGYLDWNANTISQVDGGGAWYKVTNGKIDWQFTGLTEYNNTWYYFENGVLNWKYSGLVYHCGEWYYVKNGAIDWNYDNLVEYYGVWYDVRNGQIDWNYSALSQVNGRGIWYKVTNGKVDWKYTGLVNYYGTWYYVQNGIVNWGYSGLTYYKGSWFYVRNGVLDWNYSNLVNYQGTWYYVDHGEIDWGENTLAQVDGNGTWYQVTNGKLNWNYTGLTKFYQTWYYIEDGVLRWNYTGLVYYNNVWYYCKNSVLDWNYTGPVEYNGHYYYVQNGKITWGYNGHVEMNGQTYEVVNSTLINSIVYTQSKYTGTRDAKVGETIRMLDENNNPMPLTSSDTRIATVNDQGDIYIKNGKLWIEDGTITPKGGDIIMYCWNVREQPNDGYANHVGIVTAVNGNKITVIEGNKSNSVGYRIIDVGNGYIRGYIRPRYASDEERDRVVNTMESWNGIKEGSEGHKEILRIYNSHTPVARGYLVQLKDSWCATAVSAAFIQANAVDAIYNGTECGCEKMIEKADQVTNKVTITGLSNGKTYTLEITVTNS